MIDNELGKNEKTRMFLRKTKFYYGELQSEKRTANNRRGRMVIVGAGSSRRSRSGQLVQDWYSLDRWSLVQDWFPLVQEDGRWFRNGIRWCRKVVAGPGLVVAGICWCRKVVAGSGLVVAGAELVAAGNYWCRKVAAGVCWCRKVIAGAGKRSLVQDW